MFEFAIVSLLLLAFCVLVAREGHRHLLRPGLPWAILGCGALAGGIVEALPFTPFRAAASVQTLVAVVCGLLVGRLAARGAVGWARGQERDLAAGHLPEQQRLVHPLIAGGLWISGTAMLWALVCARHERLEVAASPRDPETGVMDGAEAVALDPPAGSAGARSHGVVLVHGFLGSPADFGDTAVRLHARGFTVRSVRLPHHGTVPSALADADPADALAAVDAARDELAATHAKVSLVGFSYGGALAIRSAAARPPHRLVVANPLLGELATPAWMPVATDTLLPVVARVTPRVIRPPGMIRCNDPEGAARVRGYSTVPLGAVVRATAYAAAARDAAPECPTLVLLSETDHTTPSARTDAWYRALPVPPTRQIARFTSSDHLLFLDHDRDAAIDAIADWLAR